MAVLDLTIGRWIKEPKDSIISYLKAENANGRHILIKPKKEVESYYLLIDDISEDILKFHHKTTDKNWRYGRMVVETSPGNYQVWIHSSYAITNNEKKYWLEKLKSDPGANPNNRWGRCPGFRNRKEKYCDSKGYYPLSKLIWVDWKNEAKIPKPFSLQPWGEVFQNINFSRQKFEKGDESATDFLYAIGLMRCGCTDNEVKQKILNERTNWSNHKGERKRNSYLDRTIKNARIIVEK